MATIAQICDAIESTLDDVTAIKRSQKFSELTEDFADLPLLQVYPDSAETDALSNNDRHTFKGVRRITDAVIICDIPCKQRSHLGEDMNVMVTVTDAVIAKLEAQTTSLFGNADIKGFHWRWERVTFSRGNPEIAYVGVRFTITVKSF